MAAQRTNGHTHPSEVRHQRWRGEGRRRSRWRSCRWPKNATVLVARQFIAMVSRNSRLIVSLPLLPPPRTRRQSPWVTNQALIGAATPSPPPAPPPSATRAPARTGCGCCCPDGSGSLSPCACITPTSRRSSRRSCCPGRGRAACRYDRRRLQSASPPSR